MKKFLYSIMLLQALLFAGCNQDIMDYEGTEGVYFAVQWGDSWAGDRTWPYQPYSEVQFQNVAGNEAEVALKVMVTGAPKAYDRTFNVAVNPDSTTAVENVDYLPVNPVGVIKAGEVSGFVKVTLLRTGRLETEDVTLGLRLLPTSDFVLAFPKWDAVEGFTAGPITPRFDASLHKIIFNDKMVKPKIWPGTAVSPYNGGFESGTWGAFSRKKLEMICERFDLTYSDFMSDATMPNVLRTVIAKTMSEILIERYNSKNPVLEDDGRLMWFGYCPWLSMVGVAWIPDADYYN